MIRILIGCEKLLCVNLKDSLHGVYNKVRTKIWLFRTLETLADSEISGEVTYSYKINPTFV